ncbi:MAG: type IV-A pilus assembly ATPase PilB [Planctomycetota bacterium]|nr:MAG: type IV-A pilus assembly ATPase PilB [Planctomycetota bacterium]
MSAYDRKVRDLLVKSGKFDAETANEFLIKALGEGKSLIDYLVETQTLQETEILSLVCRDTKLPPINLDNLRFDKEIVELLPQDAAETYKVLPVSKIGKFLTLAVANPYDLYARDDIRKIIDVEIIPVVTLDRMLERNIRRAYREDEEKLKEFYEELKGSESSGIEQVEDADEEEVDISEVTDEESPVVKLVNVIIANALKQGASDIHVEPFEKRVRLRYRIDGVCHEVEPAPPKKMQNAVVSRIKIMSELDIAEKRKPQDGKFRLRYEGREIDFRVSVLPVVHGEKVVLRILDSSSLKLNLNDLGFEEKALNDFRRAITAPYGMVLVTGPTGSGKSTTLYSAIKEVLTVEKNIVTVEDPVEYQIEGVNQVPVNPKRGLTFAAALRSILRQDPDIVMIGEIRDLETAEIAVKAALTGHLVLSTLHTNDAASTITRLVDMGIDPFMVASSVLLCSAQRLGRRLCNYCKQPVEIPKERLISLGLMEEDIERFGMNLYGPKGCSRCTNGYKGRFALLETLPMTERIQRIVVSGGSALEIKKAALEEGMLTLRRVGLINALKGVTSVENVLSITLGD